MKKHNFQSKLKIFTKLKKIILLILLFYDKNKVKYAIYETKKCFEGKHVDLLLIGEEGKRHYVLIKDFNTFMHDYALNNE